jgi:hypothetical protein
MKNAVFGDVANRLLAKCQRFSLLVNFYTLKIPSKRRFLQELPGAPFKKTAFFLVTAVETSNSK